MIIIIGAGISGLYLGYLLKTINKDFIIIEKEKKYGGRVLVEDFEGTMVNLGAGVGRQEKDILLDRLCKHLNVPVSINDVKIGYSLRDDRNRSRNNQIKNPKHTFLSFLEELKLDFSKNKNHRKIRSNTTFLEFLKENLDNPEEFIKISGYTDYINADIVDTLYNYGFDDNVDGWKSMLIKWQILLDNLYKILKSHIHLSEEVINIDQKNSFITTSLSIYKYDKLVSSIPVNIARKLFPNIEILSEINCQSFSRIYAKISYGNDSLKEKIKNVFTVNSFLQKIIPINPDKGIYMIGYNDNYSADLSFKYFTTLDEEEVYQILESEILRLFNVKAKIEVAKIAYWDYGTTYYLPLSKKYKDRDEWLSSARNPIENIFFIGEGFSHNQGWVEGSLQSVESIINYL